MTPGKRKNRTARKPLMVVIVDDDAVQNNMFRNVLKRHFSEQVLELFFIKDGDAAVQVLREHPGHQKLLITDIDHPGLDGVRLARLCREKYPDVTVLIQTAFAGGEQISEAGVCADYLLQKPYRIQELVEIIEQILGRLKIYTIRNYTWIRKRRKRCKKAIMF